MPEKEETTPDCFQVLTFQQVQRLDQVMQSTVPVHGRGNFPTLNIKLKDFVRLVKNQLMEHEVHVNDVRLNGGVASYVLGIEDDQVFHDYDLIFSVQLKNQAVLQKIKDLVLSSLLDFFPKSINKDRMSLTSLNEAYVHKMVKIFKDSDKWSLISLSHSRSKNIELKFADTMRRQFEFSVDSFQIILDSLFNFYGISQGLIQEKVFPTVKAESVYGNFSLALHHLNNKIIATRNPEQIRGGGLLKYCNLLVRNFIPESDYNQMAKYMCSRFFIDFPNINTQEMKLKNYLNDHFSEEEIDLKVRYLMKLFKVVDDSTICLMGHERRQTLDLIDNLTQALRETIQFSMQYQKRVSVKGRSILPQKPLILLDQQKCKLVVEQVVYGPFFPYSSSDPYYTVYSYDNNTNSSHSHPSHSNPIYVCTVCNECLDPR